ncbi:MAG: hypothetical protein H0W62_08805 [Chitinophagales bacterium]|nr:hypothetical protein [Chitinophagales bacterium]
MNLTLPYPAWYILLCLLLGVIYAFILYYRESQFRELGASFKKVIWMLAVLRTLAISTIAFLLLSPLIRTVSNRIEKPIVVFAQDNSESVHLNQTKADSLQYANHIRDLVNNLSKNYDVKNYSFGSSLKEGIDFSYSEKATNIAAALSEIQGLYSNQNLGTIILATDGIYNQGSNPVYVNSSVNVPIYTIGLGDTTTRRDLLISGVRFNRSVFLNDYFPVKVEWQALFCPNEQSTIVISRIVNGKENTIDQKNISIQGDEEENASEFLLRANEAGVIHYQIRLSHLLNEASDQNNVRDIFVEVVEKKQKICILANAPHPDIAAIKQSIEINKNYEVQIFFNGNVPGNINDYNLFILHEIPSAQQANVSSLIQSIKAKKKSILFILGAQTNTSVFNNLQSMVNLSGGNGSTTDAVASVENTFTLFTLPDNVLKLIPGLPPLASPFADYRVSPGASVLLRQKIGAVSTAYPLILLQQDLNGRSGVIAGEGLWRWRLYDYLQNANHEAFDALISAVIQFLSIKPDEQQFRVHLEKERQATGNRIFSEDESVIFDAELLNESNELLNEPDVSMMIKDEQGKEYPFVFSKISNSYSLNAGNFPAGNYSYKAHVIYNKKDLVHAGTFSVAPTQIELLSTRANHQLLYALSEKTGGKLFYPSQTNELLKVVQAKQEIKPILYSSTRTQPLINLRWLLLPLLILMTLEWGIRKFNGGY